MEVIILDVVKKIKNKKGKKDKLPEKTLSKPKKLVLRKKNNIRNKLYNYIK